MAKDKNLTDLQKIGLNIKKYRVQKNYTQENLAYDADISNRTIQRLENGHNDAKVSTLLKISRILKINAKDLLDL